MNTKNGKVSIAELMLKFSINREKAKILLRYLKDGNVASGSTKAKRNKSNMVVVAIPERPVPEVVDNVTLMVRKLKDIRTMCAAEQTRSGEQSLIKDGFVYLIRNACFPGWVKVGMALDYESRLVTYNVYDPKAGFEYFALRFVPDRRLSEQELITKFSTKASNQRGEWLEVDEDLAFSLFYEL
jgi:hypothetical protein